VSQNDNDVTDDVLLSQTSNQPFTQTQLQLSSDDEPLSTKNYSSSSSSSSRQQQKIVAAAAAAVKGIVTGTDCVTQSRIVANTSARMFHALSGNIIKIQYKSYRRLVQSVCSQSSTVFD
jgi:hypothetical protein